MTRRKKVTAPVRPRTAAKTATDGRRAKKTSKTSSASGSDRANLGGRSWRILVSKQGSRCPLPAAAVRRMVREVLGAAPLEQLPPEVLEIEVLIVSDPRIHELNRTYRGKDKPTDVLSFSMLEGGGMIGEQLGSLIISWDTTLTQAKRFGVTPEQELLRLLVHGVLHLLGFDHEGVSATVANRMRRLERKLRRQLAERLGI